MLPKSVLLKRLLPAFGTYTVPETVGSTRKLTTGMPKGFEPAGSNCVLGKITRVQFAPVLVLLYSEALFWVSMAEM